MAKKTRTELSTLAINTNLPDNTQELITPTTERSQLTDERESVINYKDDLGGAPNAGKFLTVAVDGESLTMVDAPTGDVTGTGVAFKIAFWFDTKVITFDTALFFNTNNNRLTAAQFEATLKVISAAYEAAVGSSMTFATGETGDPSPTPRLTISSGGNVGIGGTPPSITGYTALSINNATNGAILDLEQGDAMKARFIATATTATIETASGIPFAIDVNGNGSSDLSISSGGKVIVGTDTTNALEVFSSGDTEIGFSYNTHGNIYAKIIGDITNASPLAGDIAFQTATGGTLTERLRISSGGNVGIGSGSAQTAYQLRVDSDFDNGIYLSAGTSTNNHAIYADDSSGTVLFRVRGDGAFYTGNASVSPYNNTTATASNVVITATDGNLGRSTASSRRYKENITDWNGNGLNTILSLKPKTFKYKKDYYDKADVDFLGLIAEEVAEVSPYLAEYQNEDRTGQVENVRYANIVVPLVKAIQEQQTIIEDLKSRIEKLEL